MLVQEYADVIEYLGVFNYVGFFSLNDLPGGGGRRKSATAGLCPNRSQLAEFA